MAIKSSNQITFTEHKKIVEIKEWYLATSVGEGVTIETDGWTTDIQTIDYNNKYLWNYEEVVYSIGSSDISDPIIIGFYGNGQDGKGIESIVNYYQTTTDINTPDTSALWPTQAPLLSNTNKYLWNYEVIMYTDGTTTSTDPAIIGAYGDSGADAVMFKVYSVNGFMFKQDSQSIELKIAAFDGGDAITGATYTWSWWDSRLNNGDGGYADIITNTTDQAFIVDESDSYAFANLRCTMNYNENTYEDYVVLTSETVIYTSFVKFFNGSNIFSSDDLYLVAYLDLYQNNNRVETISANSYCTGVSSVDSSGVITTELNGTFSNGDKMYFICKDDVGLYYAILGEYTSGVWNKIDYNMQYTYENTLYPNRTEESNVVVISKESINKSRNIDFTIYKDGIYISSASTMVIDSNDPIVSDNAPENPVYGQLWLNTSTTPNVLNIFTKMDGENIGRWVECSDQAGGAVFTSKPTSYHKGDLWILANDEVCEYTVDETGYKFEAGSMLKSTSDSDTYVASHWIDADRAGTELRHNVAQTFTFNPDNDTNKGLPGLTVGQTDDKFYVKRN